jgi:hypothetical protein
MNPFVSSELLFLWSCLVIGVLVPAGFVVVVAFFLTLQEALRRVSPHNRVMKPGRVWLMLIPVFNLLWQFVVVIGVPDSLRNEFRERNRDDGSSYGKEIGLAYAVTNVLSAATQLVIANAPEFQLIGGLVSGALGLANLVLFILFWVKIAGYSRRLIPDLGTTPGRQFRVADLGLLLPFALTLFVSAAFLFIVQPMIGKMILPRLGGTPAVWNTCMVFFQAMLLVGYSYTHTLSTSQNRRTQLLVQSALLFLPLALFRLPFAIGDWLPPTEENPVFMLLVLLLGVVGLPFFIVATTAPLLQKWFTTTGHRAAKDPYFLYGASNLGSMLGLLLYPVLFEPLWDVDTQAVIWTGGYVLLVACVLGCALLVWRTPEPAAVALDVSPTVEQSPAPAIASPQLAAETAVTAAPTGVTRRRPLRLPAMPAAPRSKASLALSAPAKPSPLAGVLAFLLTKDDSATSHRGEELTFLRRLRWVMLAAAPSSLMLGATTFLTTDIAAVPLFWVIPLALYLMTFILVFARWPVVWTGTPHTVVLYLQPCFLLFLVLRMVSHLSVPTWGEFTLHLLAFFSTTLMCHGELAKDRPSTRYLTEFYLWMSVGGVLGGLVNALVAPLCFPWGIIEYPIAMVASCLLRPTLIQDVSQMGPVTAAVLQQGSLSGLSTELRKQGYQNPVAAVSVLAFDSMLFTLGMTTVSYPSGTSASTDSKDVPSRAAAFIRRLVPSSNLLELFLDITVPIAFAFLAYFLVDIGAHEKEYLGITFKRSYLMAGTVVIALAMAMRPLRFGLSVGLLFLVVIVFDRSFEHNIFEDRGFFGLVRVREYTEGGGIGHPTKVRRTLIHGVINHGQQLVEPSYWRRQPISYFHPSNGIGEIFHKLTWGNPPNPMESREDYDQWMAEYRQIKYTFVPADARLPASLVGLGAESPWAQLVATQSQVPFAVVGLGTGTLAAHAQPFQHADFYEIDPIIKRLSVPPPGGTADDLMFYYVDDALHRGADLRIIMGDGRLRIKEGPEKFYHAILLDAFSSDAIPVHLLTKDAVEEYLKHLADGGVLIFNTTNKFVDIQPVLKTIADELDLECLTCPDYPDRRHPEKYGADWTVLRRKDANMPGRTYRNGAPSLYHRLDPGTPEMTRWEEVEPMPGRAWTDGHSNLLGAMRWLR